MNQIANDVVTAFRSGIRGSVLLPGDSGFDDARRVWNAMIDRKPAIIVRCLGNFGIVTLFEFQLHPTGPDIFSGLIVFPFEQAREVLDNYRLQVENMPDEMSVWVVMRHAPPLPFLPEEVHGKKIIALAVFYAGKAEDGMKAAKLLRRHLNTCDILLSSLPVSGYNKYSRVYQGLWPIRRMLVVILYRNGR